MNKFAKILLLGPEFKERETHLRIIEFLESEGHTVLSIEFEVTEDFLDQNNFDYIICFGSPMIIKKPIVERYKNRIINIHPAYLPEGKGIYPNFWSIFENRRTGVSLQYIDDGVDTGDIIARRLIALEDTQTLEASYSLLDEEVVDLFIEIWPEIRSGKVKARPQSQEDCRHSYRNRISGEVFLELFSSGWKTTIKELRDVASVYWLGEQFWDEFEGEHYSKELRT